MRDITRSDLRLLNEQQAPAPYIEDDNELASQAITNRYAHNRQSKMRVSAVPSRKYIELEKYFPIGSKGSIIEH